MMLPRALQPRLRGMIILCLLCLVSTACGGGTPAAGPATGPAGGAVASTHGVSLYLIDDPRLGAPVASGWRLDAAPVADGLTLTVRVAGAQRLRSCYCRLEFDPAQYAAVSAEAGALWGAPAERLSLAALDAPGRAYFGAVLVHPQDQPGFDGDGVVATFALVASGALPAAPRRASNAPVADASRAPIFWDQGTAELSWFYANQGDYNQDGEVGINDLTPLGIHLGEVGPFALDSPLAMIDGDGNGELNIGDITPIGANFGADALGGYRLYASNDLNDYPATNGEAPTIAALDDAPFNWVTGNPVTERLHASYTVATPLPNVSYWVRPVDNTGNEGTPSHVVGGNANDTPVLNLNNPPGTGSGTAADPYVLEGDVWYEFSVLSFSLGDLTTDPATVYYLSDPAAGGISNADGKLAPLFPFTGAVKIWAAYDNLQTSNVIYATVEPKYGFGLWVVDDGGLGGDNVGQHCSLADVASQAGIAYYDATNGALKYARWQPAIWPLPGMWVTMVVDDTGDVGQYCSLMEADNTAIIAYYDQDQGDLKIAQAKIPQPVNATDWNVYVLDAAGDCGRDCSIARLHGYPAVVYLDSITNQLRFAQAATNTTLNATDWTNFHTLDATGHLQNPSLYSVNGRAGVAYIDYLGAGSTTLYYARATVDYPAAGSDWLALDVDPACANPVAPCLQNIEGLIPAMTYYDRASGQLKYAWGNIDPAAAADWTVKVLDPNLISGGTSSLAAVHGRFCVAYNRLLDNSLWFARTEWVYAEPSNWQRMQIDSGPDVGQSCDIAEIGGPVNGWPGIAYHDYGNGTLKFAWGAESW